MITEKDRGQLLRMAGNIAGGLLAAPDLRFDATPENIGKVSAMLAIKTMEAVDKLIAERNAESRED